jgi:hypothetical protein
MNPTLRYTILHNVYPALSLFIMKEQECAGRRR